MNGIGAAQSLRTFGTKNLVVTLCTVQTTDLDDNVHKSKLWRNKGTGYLRKYKADIQLEIYQMYLTQQKG